MALCSSVREHMLTYPSALHSRPALSTNTGILSLLRISRPRASVIAFCRIFSAPMSVDTISVLLCVFRLSELTTSLITLVYHFTVKSTRVLAHWSKLVKRLAVAVAVTSATATLSESGEYAGAVFGSSAAASYCGSFAAISSSIALLNAFSITLRCLLVANFLKSLFLD